VGVSTDYRTKRRFVEGNLELAPDYSQAALVAEYSARVVELNLSLK
jgi:hypothetical protein